MVTTYKRKTERGRYGSHQLQMALESVRNGTSLLAAAKEYGVPERTLRRHKEGTVRNPGQSRLGRHRVVLTDELETDLRNHIQSMEKALFGLTTHDVRLLAYEVAEHHGIRHPFSKREKKCR